MQRPFQGATGGVGVVALGVAFLGVSVLDVVAHVGIFVDELQWLYVGTASVALVGCGLVLRRHDARISSQWGVFAWTLAGGGFLLVLALFSIWDGVRTASVSLSPVTIIFRLVVFGCLGGFVSGYFQQRARQERTHSESHLEQFEILFEETPLPLVVLSLDGRVEMWNAAAAALFGFSAQEVTGRQTPVIPSSHESEFETHLAEMQSGGSLEGVRTKRRRRDGTLLDVEVWATSIPNPHGSCSQILVVYRDLTNEAILEEQREVMQRIFRHNVRNELTIIRGYTREIADCDAAIPNDYTGKIASATDRLRSLSERMSTLELESTVRSQNVVEMLHRAASTVREAHPSVELSVDAPEQAWSQTVPAMENALVEAMENGIVHADDERVSAAVAVYGDVVEMRIRDYGPGIPDSEWEPIAARTENQLQHTSGLGLWLMHWAAARSGGTLTRRRVEPRGTEVTFRLPKTLSGVDPAGHGSAERAPESSRRAT